MNDARIRRISLFGTCLLIPFDLWLAFGLTFTGPQNISAWHWAFVWFTFLLNIPAVLVSWSSPRFAAYWVVVNTAISLLIGAGFLRHSYIEAVPEYGALKSVMMAGAQAWLGVVILWFPHLLFAGKILFLLRQPAATQT